MTDTTIIEVKIDEVLPYLSHMFIEHREEVTTNKELMILNPDMDTYYALEEQGRLIVLCVYKEGEVIGYSVNMIQPHLHYKDLVYSSNDLLFVSKEYRNSKVGLQLIKDTEAVCKAKGSQFHLWHAKENTTLAELLPRMGYSIQDIMFSKEI